MIKTTATRKEHPILGKGTLVIDENKNIYGIDGIGTRMYHLVTLHSNSSLSFLERISISIEEVELYVGQIAITQS
jgi:hypothetical protein